MKKPRAQGWVLISRQGNMHPPLSKTKAINMILDPEDRVVRMLEFDPLEAAVLREVRKCNKARKQPGAFTAAGEWDPRPMWKAIDLLEEKLAGKK